MSFKNILDVCENIVTIIPDKIKYLLFEKKWMKKIEYDITEAIDLVLNNLASKVVLIAKRYEKTLGEIEEKTAKSREKVKAALERMGYTW